MSEVIAIIGAGQAGSWAAVTLRDKGYTGRLVLIGNENLQPYERPPLSKTALTAAEPPEPKWVHAADAYAQRDIELMLNQQVSSIHTHTQHVQFEDGRTLHYDKLLLATGGDARRLQIPGAQFIHYLRTYDDALALRTTLAPRSRVVCIGAGVIGLECAASAQALGSEVCVVDAMPNVMARTLSHAPARAVQHYHEEHGIQFVLNTGIERIAPAGNAYEVTLTDGQVLSCDTIIAGVGLHRDLTLAATASIASRQGIVVDEFGRTSIPGIYAAGDIAEFWHPVLQRHIVLETWAHAQNHGCAVAASMAGVMTPYSDVTWFWSDQADLNIEVTGDCMAKDALEVMRQSDAGSAWFYIRDGLLVGAAGLNCRRDIRMAKALIHKQSKVDIAKLTDPAIAVQKAV